MGNKVIITGASGMVGGGVLIECLEDENIDEVLVVGRKSLDLKHPKLSELLVSDFMEIETHQEKLNGYQAIFYCMGVSAFRMDEAKYTHLTYDYAKAFADVLFEANPDMTFIYVSGAGTDSTEKKNIMWARVKGKTENMILSKGFAHAFAFRPGAIVPRKGVKSRTALYQRIYDLTKPFYSLFLLSNKVTTSDRIGKAMIRSLSNPFPNPIVTEPLINQWGK